MILAALILAASVAEVQTAWQTPVVTYTYAGGRYTATTNYVTEIQVAVDGKAQNIRTNSTKRLTKTACDARVKADAKVSTVTVKPKELGKAKEAEVKP
jgi:hypothetical protein